MDDYNLSAISQAKHEYSMNFVNILTPLLIEGIKSIFKEAWELCISNEEKGKYLMTFQNFLTRVPKWNQTIINGETERIISQSGCSYLEDLVTCVHISQLKILTSIRVANKQKKVDIEVPKLSDFIHKVYIKFARKLYSNVYLFELQIPSLQIQKNNSISEDNNSEKNSSGENYNGSHTEDDKCNYCRTDIKFRTGYIRIRAGSRVRSIVG